MPALTHTDVGHLVREMNDTYQPKGVCMATPRRMKHLLQTLEDYTDEVQFARHKYQALGVASIAFGPGGIAVGELLGGGDVDVAQWRRDMTNWQFRLAHYEEILDSIPPEMMDTPEGCAAIYPDVTAPLLDGIFYEVLPGIVLNQAEKTTMARGDSHCPAGVERCVDVPYRQGGGVEVEGAAPGDHPMGHSNPKPPDLISPFTLGNQIIVYQDFQKENLRRLIDDLIKGAKKIVDPDKWPWWVWAGIVAAGGTVVGVAGLYVYQFLPKPAKSNPRRRRRRNPHISAAKRREAKKLLAAAAEYREYGEDYNRAIDSSAQRVEAALERDRSSELNTFSKELAVRIEAGRDAG